MWAGVPFNNDVAGTERANSALSNGGKQSEMLAERLTENSRTGSRSPAQTDDLLLQG